MAVMIVCGALLLAGLAAGFWSRRPFQVPVLEGELSAVEVARRFVWYTSLVLVGGIAAGIPVIGAGGRLAMRLLASTAGDDAQGRLTEADEVVGKITVAGTIDFIVFNGVFGGIIAAALFLIVRRFLPRRQLGGLVFGLGLLAVLGTTIDRLRDENPDFDIVGPGWLAAVVFTALAVAFGLSLVGILTRLSAWLPLLSADRRVLAHYAVPAAVAVVAFSVTAGLILVGLAVVAVTRSDRVVEAIRSTRTVLLGRVVVALVVVVSLPGAIRSIAAIATR